MTGRSHVAVCLLAAHVAHGGSGSVRRTMINERTNEYGGGGGGAGNFMSRSMMSFAQTALLFLCFPNASPDLPFEFWIIIAPLFRCVHVCRRSKDELTKLKLVVNSSDIFQ